METFTPCTYQKCSMKMQANFQSLPKILLARPSAKLNSEFKHPWRKSSLRCKNRRCRCLMENRLHHQSYNDHPNSWRKTYLPRLVPLQSLRSSQNRWKWRWQGIRNYRCLNRDLNFSRNLKRQLHQDRCLRCLTNQQSPPNNHPNLRRSVEFFCNVDVHCYIINNCGENLFLIV